MSDVRSGQQFRGQRAAPEHGRYRSQAQERAHLHHTTNQLRHQRQYTGKRHK